MALRLKPDFERWRLTYRQKLFLLTTLPLVLSVAAITLIVTYQARQLAEKEISALQEQLLDAKREELKNYIAIARTAFINIYGRAGPDDEEAKLAVTQILSSMIYGQDGYFFVFDYDGTNLVAPRQTELIGKNWLGLQDQNGISVTDELIRIARAGGGYHEFAWPKPSTGEIAPMILYVNGLQDWQWVVGTGIFIDEVVEGVANARADVEARIGATTIAILAITILALLAVYVSGLVINTRERRLADAKLKALTERIIDTQEEERGRVARELHDSISQILVSVRYALELTQRRLSTGDARASESLAKGATILSGAIQEVRRISRDLRPGALDDLGLGPAIQTLVADFGNRTGIKTDFETVVFRGRLDEESRIALYRIAQEALTNIERHSGATHASVLLKGNRKGANMRIADNGCGMSTEGSENTPGLGLRNMLERVEQLDGTLHITSGRSGTVIEVQIPLSHMLPPRPESRAEKEIA